MTALRLFQYAVSRDPEVVAAIQRNEAGEADVHRRACQFAMRHGDDPEGGYYDGSFAGRVRPSAIASKTKPTTGRWKKGPRGYGFAPYENNPLSEEFKSIVFQCEKVPGLPGMLRGPGRADWSHVIYWPKPFVWDGAAWVGVSGQVVEDEGSRTDDYGPQWSEILASEFHAAREAVIASDKACLS